jgi:hypothetical protein
MNRRMIEENGSAQMNVEILKGQCEQSLTLQLLQCLHSGRRICHTDAAKQVEPVGHQRLREARIVQMLLDPRDDFSRNLIAICHLKTVRGRTAIKYQPRLARIKPQLPLFETTVFFAILRAHRFKHHCLDLLTRMIEEKPMIDLARWCPLLQAVDPDLHHARRWALEVVEETQIERLIHSRSDFNDLQERHA